MIRNKLFLLSLFILNKLTAYCQAQPQQFSLIDRSNTLTFVLLISPLVIGLIIALLNSDGVNNTTEKAESWIRKAQSKAATKRNWFTRYIINPILWLIVQFSNWTDGFAQRGLKNGVRVAISIYLIIAWCFILYTAFMIMLILVISVIVIYVLLKILVNSNDDVKRGYDAGKRIFGPAGKGKRVNPDTGVIQKEGFLGWQDTDKRIDPETGNVQEEGFLGWNDTDSRIDQETGNIQKEGFFGYVDSETRINPETGIIQKQGLLGWADTDERIDPETGKHQKRGLLGWIDD